MVRNSHFVFVLTLDGFVSSNPEYWLDADCGARIKTKYVNNAKPTCKACAKILATHQAMRAAHERGELYCTVTRLY